jgi:hypothetical protein
MGGKMNCPNCIIKEFASKMCSKLLSVPTDCPLNTASCSSTSELANLRFIISSLKILREEYQVLDNAQKKLSGLRFDVQEKIEFLEGNFDVEDSHHKDYILDFFKKIKSERIKVSNDISKDAGGKDG